MSPSSSRRRPRRPPRPPRAGRNRPPQHAATSALVSSILLVTTVWLIASATYYAVQFFEQMRVEQRASVADSVRDRHNQAGAHHSARGNACHKLMPASPTNHTQRPSLRHRRPNCGRARQRSATEYIAPPIRVLRVDTSARHPQRRQASLRPGQHLPSSRARQRRRTRPSPINDTVTSVANATPPRLRTGCRAERAKINMADTSQ